MNPHETRPSHPGPPPRANRGNDVGAPAGYIGVDITAAWEVLPARRHPQLQGLGEG
jgi:hypothetical protein